MGVLEDLFETRTNRDRYGTISAEWDLTLLWRDLERLQAEKLVSAIEITSNAASDSLKRLYFRDSETGDVYVFVEGGEKSSPKFHKLH